MRRPHIITVDDVLDALKANTVVLASMACGETKFAKQLKYRPSDGKYFIRVRRGDQEDTFTAKGMVAAINIYNGIYSDE